MTGNHPVAAAEGIAAAGVEGVLRRMSAVLRRLESSQDPRRYFLGTYARTTAAVRDAIRAGRFEDPAWVDRWDVAFAELYLDALEAFERRPASAPRPWRVALRAEADLHPLQLVLLGMNAHINYDLPQALLAVISDQEFADERLMARRHRDHVRIDAVLASRVAAEDGVLKALARGATGVPGRSLLDRAMTPVNRSATKRFLAEARSKVWQNTVALRAARLRGADAYAGVLGELELLSAARINDLLAPGHVLVRLAAGGFGVRLPPS